MSQPYLFESPRLMRTDERLASSRLFAACFGGPNEDVTGDFAFEEAPGNETAVIAHDGKLVSQIGIFPERLVLSGAEISVGSIGGVGTHPDYRGHGLATQLMEFCAARLRQSGTHILLISGARGLYTRLGNVPPGIFQRFVLRPDRVGQTAPLEGLRLAEERDAAPCSQLYEHEPAHFLRPASAFAECFRKREIGYHAENWIIERGGVPAGYLLFNVPWEFVDQPQAGVRSVFEYAGDRAELSRALVETTAMHGLSEVEILVPWQDEALASLLRAACPAAEMGTVPLPDHTLRILHFPALMEALDPFFSARLGSAATRGLRVEQSGPLLAASGADQCVMSLGEETLALDGAAMSRLVFGDYCASDPASHLPWLPEQPPLLWQPPLPMLPRGALREFVEAVFPLPSFFAGLNYH